MTDKHLHLLVHAGAASLRQDDGKYTAQAEAYFNLTSSRRRYIRVDSRAVDISPAQPSTQVEAQGREPHPTMEPAQGSTDIDATLYVEDTQLAYTALESQLRSSSRSVVKQTPTTTRSEGSRASMAATTSSKCKSGLSQSSYLDSPRLERSKQGKRLQEHEQTQKLPRVVRKPTLNTPAGHGLVPRTDGSEREDSEQTVSEYLQNSSELPTSYSLSEGASARSADRPRLPEKSVSDPGPLAADLAKGTIKHALPARPSVSPLRPTEEDAPERQIRKASSELQLSSKRPRISRISAPLGNSEHRISLEIPSQILPPGPETSIRRFESHVTPALQHLVENSAVASSFHPVSQVRELEASERGYWLVRCQEWAITEQMAFWQTLEKSIASAGWGVWCSRGTDAQLRITGNEHADWLSVSQNANDAVEPVRVWCWGEVVKHLYLLLYVASKSKIRRLGLQWIDSEGNVVIQMRQAAE